MAWDHILLRKYNSTGPFRLLSQLKSQLKAQPLVRDSSRKTTEPQKTPTNTNPSKIAKSTSTTESRKSTSNNNNISAKPEASTTIFNSHTFEESRLHSNDRTSKIPFSSFSASKKNPDLNKEIDIENKDDNQEIRNNISSTDQKRTFRDRLNDIDMR